MLENDPLVQLQVDVELLKREVTSLRHISTALAAQLCRLSPESMHETQSLLAAMIPYAKHMNEVPSDIFVRAFLRDLEILTADGVAPEQHLMMQALFAKDAGTDRLTALEEWFSQATPDEIEQEMLRLLDQLQKPDADVPDA